MGISTISMAIFHSYVCLPEGISFAPAPHDATEIRRLRLVGRPTRRRLRPGRLGRRSPSQARPGGRRDGDVTLRSDAWAMVFPINGWYIGIIG